MREKEDKTRVTVIDIQAPSHSLSKLTHSSTVAVL